MSNHKGSKNGEAKQGQESSETADLSVSGVKREIAKGTAKGRVKGTLASAIAGAIEDATDAARNAAVSGRDEAEVRKHEEPIE